MAGETLDVAYVEIKPKIDDAEFAKLGSTIERSLAPTAAKIDKSLGRAFDKSAARADAASSKIDGSLSKTALAASKYGDKISTGLSSGVTEGVDRSTRSLSSFERSFTSAARRAADGLSGSLNPEIAKIEAELRDLANTRVGIDISSDEARKELARLRQELATVGGKTEDIAVKVDTHDAIREIDGLDGAFERAERAARGSFARIETSAEKAASKTSGAFSATGTKVVAGLAAAGAAERAFRFLGDSIGDASHLNETISKTEVILGKGAAAAEKFASKADRAFGLSEQQALDAISTFATLGKGAGLVGGDLSKFSTGLTGLSADLASFADTNADTAIDAIGAALRGETEPIRSFGVLIDAASIKAEALASGLVKASKNTNQIKAAQVAAITAQQAYNDATKKYGADSLEAQKAQAALGTAQDRLKKATKGTIPELTNQQKVLATQSLIYKQTKDAQGDFARTSKGLAGQQKTLGATFENVSAKIGKRLIPAATLVVTILNKILSGGPATKAVLIAVGVAVGVITAALLVNTAAWVANSVATAANTVATVASRVAAVASTAATAAMTAAQWALNAALSANPIGLVVAAVAALVIGLVIAYKKSDKFRAIVDAVGKALKTAFIATSKAVGKVIGFVIGIVKKFGDKLLFLLGPIGAVVFAFRHWDAIKKVLSTVGAAVLRFVAAAVGAFGSLLKVVLAVLGGIVKAAAKAFGWIPGIGGKLKSAEKAFNGFSSNATKSVDKVQAGLKKMSDKLEEVGRKKVNPKIDVAAGKALSQIKAVDLKIAALTEKKRQIALGANTKEARDKIAALDRQIAALRNKKISLRFEALVGSSLNNLLTGGADHNPLTPRAKGGIIRRPEITLMGEDGIEAVVPLTRKYAGRTMKVLEESGIFDRVDVQNEVVRRVVRGAAGLPGEPGPAGLSPVGPTVVRERRAAARENVLSGLPTSVVVVRSDAAATSSREKAAREAPTEDVIARAVAKAVREALAGLPLGGETNHTWNLLPNGDPATHAEQVAARIAASVGR